MISNKNANNGFTLVELLIVIVVIAILAAISVVAYNGIQNRSKASAAQNLASQIAKKAEAYNAIESIYPSYAQLTSNSGNGTPRNPAEAKLDDTSSVTSTPAPDASNGTSVVQYVACGTTGARINWWDYANNRITTTSTTPSSITVGTC